MCGSSTHVRATVAVFLKDYTNSIVRQRVGLRILSPSRDGPPFAPSPDNEPRQRWPRPPHGYGGEGEWALSSRETCPANNNFERQWLHVFGKGIVDVQGMCTQLLMFSHSFIAAI